ncbi:MAG TPA: single-stranded-DNA-specific exonuclease RecJ [Terriglobales bacterium]|nr:single-stranded-DNA-specific exonuclease RecJ [Terriglobales bacterium]
MRWNLRSANGMDAQRLAAEAGISPTLARLLSLRGVTGIAEAQRFLSPALSHLHSPYAMSGMAAAVERLRAALERKEKILIYGDYDVDGTTAIVILVTAIRLCGGEADFHVPHRIREGYGMKDDVIERAAGEGVRLIVSVDTGIRAFDAAQTARRVGVDLIVTDHHLPHEGGVPEALVVLNPNQPGCQYPCKDLCGAGVAFKLAHAFMEKALPDGRKLQSLLESFLKPLAIATIADAVPLVDENRVFASLGLAGLRSPVNVGLKALLEVAQLDGSRPLNSTDVAFRLAPRLNAAGRMDVARDVIELFTTKDMARAREIAERLNQLNSERQAEEARIVEEICRTLDDSPERREAYCIVVDGEGWHRGVIGIAATRVVERYCRPALVISRLGDEAHGSGRSIPSFHLLNALESCQELFSRYGGHAHAVGFALPAERVPQLRSAMDGYARTQLTPQDFEPILNLDGELGLAQVTPELYDALGRLEPFGLGNPEPKFLARNVRVLLPPRVLKEKHIKMKLAVEQDGRKSATGIPAIGWGMAERWRQEQVLAGDVLDVAFTLEHNDHPEFGGLELRLCDVARVGSAATGVGSAAAKSGTP